MKPYADDPREHEVELHVGKTLALTGLVNKQRVTVSMKDPLFSQVNPPERWVVHVTTFIKDKLWAAKLVRRFSSPDESPQEPSEAVPMEQRHIGNNTPEHLKIALATLPITFEISIDFQDHLGKFGRYQGLVIRICGKNRKFTGVIGRKYRVTPFASGPTAISANIIAEAENQTEFIPRSVTEQIPDVLEVTFDQADRLGLLQHFGPFVIRPASDWVTAEIGTTYRVRVVRVVRVSNPHICVIPL